MLVIESFCCSLFLAKSTLLFFPRYKGAKRHSSTGDALELFRGNLQLQKRLRDLEAGNSTSSLESNGNGKPAHRITDF